MSLVSVVSRQVEVPETGRELVHGSPTKCGMSECDRESSSIRTSRAIRGFKSIEKKALWNQKQTNLVFLRTLYW
jgi:hypothetical protein